MSAKFSEGLPRVRILSAAEWDLNIPETVAGRRRKQFRWLVNHSLLFMSVVVAFAVVGMAAQRAYNPFNHVANQSPYNSCSDFFLFITLASHKHFPVC
ncbi:hypothetical protein NC653_005564 [Populus alba x Populus x berolinensis]|uniref:Uncharacterized protein n=1 Tax=Populus alba x Populus x berolinensis TaxID=444605 RepID=A0AAD6RCI9_9ROSI|nr:hypothetical protein NC653_005564 [Populus alba x Populus x berolinensis]